MLQAAKTAMILISALLFLSLAQSIPVYADDQEQMLLDAAEEGDIKLL
jgi:hypothetical protein